MDDVVLPEGTLDLRDELVPAVRALLRRGLDDAFMASCVRIGAFRQFGGGLKARLVGGVRVDVDAVLKLGDDELELHRRVMERVNRERAGTFPAVLDLVRLDRSRRLLIMEQLRKHETLLDWTYRRPTTKTELDAVLDKVVDATRAVRRAGDAPRIAGLDLVRDPYTARIRSRLESLAKHDPAIGAMRRRPGRVMGLPCPPLDRVVAELGPWMRRALAPVPQRLVHGDLHLGNIMVRRRGSGLSVRLIDPNPLAGYTDPLYDAGKLLHWAEPVGWARIDPLLCRSRLISSKTGAWRLDARVTDVPSAAESRREHLEQSIRTRLAAVRRPDPARAARLEIAIAAAHVGLAALLRRPEDEEVRRFVFAYAVRALARWWAQLPETRSGTSS